MFSPFWAVDVETANADVGSICQIGLVRFERGEAVEQWESLVDPQAYFHPANCAVHGLSATDVCGAPTLAQVADEIHARMHGQVVVSHMPFDRHAITRAFSLQARTPPLSTWVDSAAVARRAWSDVARRGYGLGNLVQRLGITGLRHHDALDDAMAAGQIMLRAMADTDTDLSHWINRQHVPVNVAHDVPAPARKPTVGVSWRPDGPTRKMPGNPAGRWFGEVLVFTGDLSLSRMEAARMAATAGCDVAMSITRKTTILVVGAHGPGRLLPGAQVSGKQRRAEDAMAAGQRIRIIGEAEFLRMMAADA